MRVLLVVYDNGSYVHWFPQGLAYIAAVLRREKCDVQIYNQDFHHYPDEHLTRFLDANKFDVVGIGVVGGYYQYRKLLALSQAINKSKNRPFFVIGGHGPAPEPEYFLKKTQADAAVIGEGEETIVELIQVVAARRSLEGIRGIAYRQGNEVVVNKRRDVIKDLNSIPFPAYDLFPIHYYRLVRIPNTSAFDFVMPVLSARGCPYHCTFCYRMDPGSRVRSNESIIDEIKLLQEKYGITYVSFDDELLMVSVARTESLCQALIKARLGIKWFGNGRLNIVKPDLLRLMKQAGCVFVCYGIEAMDDCVLHDMKKVLTTKQIVDGVQATLDAGISPGLNLMFGNIGDTKETLRKGVEFLLKYDDGSQLRTMRPVTPYPGSELYTYAIKKGLLKDCEDFYERKHVNSDLLSVNFTELSDEEFHACLLEANTVLLENYFRKKCASMVDQARQLYSNRDISFRGFRQL